MGGYFTTEQATGQWITKVLCNASILLLLMAPAAHAQANQTDPTVNTTMPEPSVNRTVSTFPPARTPDQGPANLLAFYQMAFNNSNATLLPVTALLLSPENITTAPPGRRLLDGTVPVDNIGDSIYTVVMDIFDSKGVKHPAGAANHYHVRFDTGSADLILPGYTDSTSNPQFDTTGLTSIGSFAATYGGGNVADDTRTGNVYAGAFQFADQKAPQRITQDFAVYTTSVKGVKQKDDTTLLGLGVNNANENPTATVSMIQQGLLTLGAFSVYLINPPVIVANAATPGGQLGLGTSIPNAPPLTNVDEACTVVAGPPANTWTVNLVAVTVSTAAGSTDIGCQKAALGDPCSACTAASPCLSAVDTGNFDLALSQATADAFHTALGIDISKPPAFNPGRGSTFYTVDCSLLSASYPTLDYQILDRVYSLAPRDYIQQYKQSANAAATCFSTTVAGDFGFSLGDPFLVKYPSTYFAQGIPALATPLPSTAQPTVCFYGTVPVKAECSFGLRSYFAGPGCSTVFTKAALIALIDANNPLAIFTSNPPRAASTVFDITPAPNSQGNYILTGGNTYSFTLLTSNPVSKDSCSVDITLVNIPPTAVCAQTLVLPATSNCAAQISGADLLSDINAGSTPGNGNTPTLTLNPPPPPGGSYNLPVGTYPISLTVSNCAGTDTCSTLVSVVDQEQLDASKISCGAVPADGVLETPLLTKDKTTPVATYSPAYTKANGCPTTLITDNLSCRNCLAGSNKEQQGSWDHCDSSITSKGVSIFSEQKGRVAWTVTVEDQADHEATTDCAICADHGDKVFTTLGQCPTPFTTATPCDFGNL